MTGKYAWHGIAQLVARPSAVQPLALEHLQLAEHCTIIQNLSDVGLMPFPLGVSMKRRNSFGVELSGDTTRAPTSTAISKMRRTMSACSGISSILRLTMTLPVFVSMTVSHAGTRPVNGASLLTLLRFSSNLP